MAIWAMADLHLSLGTDKPMDNFRGWYDYVNRIEHNWREMGFHSLTDIVGRTDLIEVRPAEAGSKAAHLDFSRLLQPAATTADLHFVHTAPTSADTQGIDERLLAASAESLASGREISLEFAITNTDRSVGAVDILRCAFKMFGQGLGDRRRATFVTFGHGRIVINGGNSIDQDDIKRLIGLQTDSSDGARVLIACQCLR